MLHKIVWRLKDYLRLVCVDKVDILPISHVIKGVFHRFLPVFQLEVGIVLDLQHGPINYLGTPANGNSSFRMAVVEVQKVDDLHCIKADENDKEGEI